jgi:hypothetical protein
MPASTLSVPGWIDALFAPAFPDDDSEAGAVRAAREVAACDRPRVVKPPDATEPSLAPVVDVAPAWFRP